MSQNVPGLLLRTGHGLLEATEWDRPSTDLPQELPERRPRFVVQPEPPEAAYRGAEETQVHLLQPAWAEEALKVRGDLVPSSVKGQK